MRDYNDLIKKATPAFARRHLTNRKRAQIKHRPQGYVELIKTEKIQKTLLFVAMQQESRCRLMDLAKRGYYIGNNKKTDIHTIIIDVNPHQKTFFTANFRVRKNYFKVKYMELDLNLLTIERGFVRHLSSNNWPRIPDYRPSSFETKHSAALYRTK